MLILLISVAGISYAYFTIQIVGSETASSMRLRTANMQLIYNDVQIISGDYAEPTGTKTLTVTNLSCTKDTDKFSVGNRNVELNYPVGLATSPEMNIMTNAMLRTTG